MANCDATIQIKRYNHESNSDACEWYDLYQRASNSTPFQSRQWGESWLEVYFPKRQPFRVEARIGKDLVGLWNLVMTRSPGRVLRPVGFGSSDYLHPLLQDINSSVYNQMVSSIFEFADHKKCAVDLTRLRADFIGGPNESISNSSVGHKVLVCELPTTFDLYRNRLSKSLRYDLGRLSKRSFRGNDYNLETVESENIAKGMEVLFELHWQRWHSKKLPGSFLWKSREFHLTWATKAASQGSIKIIILKKNGNPIGAFYGFCDSSTTFYYQAGMNVQGETISPGSILIGEAIRQTIEEGGYRFDFLRGLEPYKYRWKPNYLHELSSIYQPQPGRFESVGLGLHDFRRRIERQARSKIESWAYTNEVSVPALQTIDRTP